MPVVAAAGMAADAEVAGLAADEMGTAEGGLEGEVDRLPALRDGLIHRPDAGALGPGHGDLGLGDEPGLHLPFPPPFFLPLFPLLQPT